VHFQVCHPPEGSSKAAGLTFIQNYMSILSYIYIYVYINASLYLIITIRSMTSASILRQSLHYLWITESFPLSAIVPGVPATRHPRSFCQALSKQTNKQTTVQSICYTCILNCFDAGKPVRGYCLLYTQEHAWGTNCLAVGEGLLCGSVFAVQSCNRSCFCTTWPGKRYMKN